MNFSWEIWRKKWDKFKCNYRKQALFLLSAIIEKKTKWKGYSNLFKLTRRLRLIKSSLKLALKAQKNHPKSCRDSTKNFFKYNLKSFKNGNQIWSNKWTLFFGKKNRSFKKVSYLESIHNTILKVYSRLSQKATPRTEFYKCTK